MNYRKAFTSINSKPHSVNHDTWVCSACYPFALEIGKIWGNGSLIYMAPHPLDKMQEGYEGGKYAILQGQGHRDDECVRFSDKPIWKRTGKDWWKNELQPLELIMNMESALGVYETAREFKIYNEKTENRFEWWFIKQLAGLVARFEKKFGPVEKFYESFVKEREIYVKDRNAKYEEQAKAQKDLLTF